MNNMGTTRSGAGRVRALLLAALALGGAGCLTAIPSRTPQHGSGTASHPAGAAPASTLVLRGVTVIDVTTGRRHPAQTVVIVGNRIRQLGAAKAMHIPPGTQVIDVTGQFLVPGFWDMHAHVDDHVDVLYPRFIAYGVTGLREMAQRFPGGMDSFRVWQRQVLAGTRLGPRVYGPSADLTYHLFIPTPEDAPRIVDSLKAAGALFLKVHNDQMNPAKYFAVAREARKIGIPFVGHVPVDVSNIEASDSGQRSVEHVEENHSCWTNWPEPLDTLDAAVMQQCKAVAAAYVRNGTWMSPTVVGANYFPEHNVALAQQFVHLMYHWGVRMLAGTDFNIDMMQDGGFWPGQSLLEDIVYLGGAMTPLEALQAATLNPALFMHATDSLGTVAPGKLADLVVLAADPLIDIHNVQKIQAVVANGRYLNRTTLDSLRVTGR